MQVTVPNGLGWVLALLVLIVVAVALFLVVAGFGPAVGTVFLLVLIGGLALARMLP